MAPPWLPCVPTFQCTSATKYTLMGRVRMTKTTVADSSIKFTCNISKGSSSNTSQPSVLTIACLSSSCDHYFPHALMLTNRPFNQPFNHSSIQPTNRPIFFITGISFFFSVCSISSCLFSDTASFVCHQTFL